MIFGLVALAMLAFAASMALREPVRISADIPRGSEGVADFWDWPPAAQERYINTAVDTAYLIALQNDRAQARCLSDWYDLHHAAAFAYVLASVYAAPEDHPPYVAVLSVLERKCGPIAYR